MVLTVNVRGGAMTSINTLQIRAFTKELGDFAKRAIPFAEMRTMNDAAFEGRRMAVKKIKKDMILRNKFTIKGLQVDKATIPDPVARLGSTRKYMRTQEFGGMKRGSTAVPLTTGVASGEGRITRPRKRLARQANRLLTIKLKNKAVTGKTNKQQLLMKIRTAVETGERFFYHAFNDNSKGIFKVIGGNKNRLRKRGKIKGTRIEMMHNLTKKSVRIPKSPWLAPTIDKLRPRVPAMFIKRLKQQVERQRLFKARKGIK